MPTKMLVLLGDSITQGLGSKQINFTTELERNLGKAWTVNNMALTGTTILYASTLLGKIAVLSPNTVAVLYGNVCAQIRPCSTGKIFKHIPKRYQGSGMLMPRPFYSHVTWKNAFQHLDNVVRSLFSALRCF